jgi:hypothetical protein
MANARGMVWNWNYISALKIAATVTAVKHGGVGTVTRQHPQPAVHAEFTAFWH